MTTSGPLERLMSGVTDTRRKREELYRWFHQHPETAFIEFETSRRIAQELHDLGIDPIAVGSTGQVGIVCNGPGPVVMMRADFDALPCTEESGKPYAADPELGRMHACGHDFHTVGLLGATEVLLRYRQEWSGTFIALFQPAEEIGQGAQAMVDAGLVDKVPAPDVVFGQHVMSTLPGGHVGAVPGPMFSAAALLNVTIFGTGGHGSMPHTTVDPIVIAAHVITRLQTIVSRELEPGTFAAVTVGAIHAGEAANTIPDSAQLKISTRAYDEEVEQHLFNAIERIVRAEAAAAGADREPTFELAGRGPLTSNDPAATARVMESFRATFGENYVDIPGPWTGSEDFSNIPRAYGAPYCYWCLGGFKRADAPSNHSPKFAPDLQPTLDRASETILAAIAPWLLGSDSDASEADASSPRGRGAEA